MQISRFFPFAIWAKGYCRDTLMQDGVAALIVTLMLIPQSLAYAMLAGLPAEVGLYASIAPLLFYAVFGSSRTLAVGPVALVSLLTASAVGNLGLETTEQAIAAAAVLALVSGVFLFAMGLLRLGFIADLLSHPVVAGFILASGLLIALSQLKHLLGIPLVGHSLIEIAYSLYKNASSVSLPTALTGISAIGLLLVARHWLKPALVNMKVPVAYAGLLAKTGPVLAIAVTGFAAWVFDLPAKGVALVGEVPTGLPSISSPQVFAFDLSQLLLPAILISLIGFVETVSIAKTLAAKRGERIDPNQELLGLGAANVSSAFSGGFPVTGGFTRSVVNFDAGARTPFAGVLTAIGIALAALFLTSWLFYLPKATLAATIVIAVLSLVDFSVFRSTWIYSKYDFLAVLVTVLATLLLSVEIGVLFGIGISLLLHLYKTSNPHIAEVGLIRGTEHFRNVNRHDVETRADVISLRVDESLYFANVRQLEELIEQRITNRPELRSLILQCSAINSIDASALEILERLNERLADRGIQLHLSEVKGPVMDRLRSTELINHLKGRIHLSHFAAYQLA